MSGNHDKPLSDGRALVGYGQPPVQHRFKRGTSGNPKGRPKKRKEATLAPAVSVGLAIDDALLHEAYRPIQLREGETALTISTVSAVYRAMAVSAVKGNRLAQQAFTERVQQAEARRRSSVLEVIGIAAEYKYGWTPIFDDHAKRGLPPPNVLPDPRDMIEGHDGMPYVVGPETEPEKQHWDKLQARAEQSDLSIRQNLAELKRRSMQNEPRRACRRLQLLRDRLKMEFRGQGIPGTAGDFQGQQGIPGTVYLIAENRLRRMTASGTQVYIGHDPLGRQYELRSGGSALARVMEVLRRTRTSAAAVVA